MEAIIERCAGLDVHQATVVACCLIAPQQSRQSLQSHYTLSLLLRCGENWPRLSAEQSRVAGGPRSYDGVGQPAP